MTFPTDVKVTSEVLWDATLILAPIDAVFVSLLAWRLRAEAFRQLKSLLTITTGVFWFLVWAVMVSPVLWGAVYHYVFPEWARWFIPPAYGFLFGAVGLSFWWLAMRLPGSYVVNCCILGGLWGMVTHLWAIYRGILEKPPMLRGASPLAATVFPFFEFTFYWCVIITIASLIRLGMGKKAS